MVKKKMESPKRLQLPKGLKSPKRLQPPKKKPTSKSQNYQIGKKIFKLTKTTIKDIRKLQLSTELCLPKLPFSKVVREILMEFCQVDMKVERKALDALHEAAEIYLTQLFEDSNKCAAHARRITLKPVDMKIALSIRGVKDPGYPSG